MPPLVGVAVNVIEVPAQIVVALADTLTDGTTLGVTTIVILLDDTEAGDAHAAEEVRTQLTTSLLTNALFEYEDVLVPTLLPFSFH